MEDLISTKSPLEKERIKFPLSLPKTLQNLSHVQWEGERRTGSIANEDQLKKIFPKTFGQPVLELVEEGKEKRPSRALHVGVVLSGGQAAGGHNVILGLFDGIKKLHPDSQLTGFLEGPGGIVENKWIEITSEKLNAYRNTGGFDLIGSGRTKIETDEQLKASLITVQSLRLDGLIIIGGDDSNTNAALLAEFFLANGSQTKVVGVPKTIDGDLKNAYVEVSFGFDTACKIYSEMIGNIARDALSAKKYTHFVKLMGRSASHIALECALQTHPNITLIGEEIAARNMTLHEITDEIVEVICRRAAKGKHYGIILIPEGLIEFIPEMKQLIQELNGFLAKGMDLDAVNVHLSKQSQEVFSYLPNQIQSQLLFDRDPHGNVQVSHIATEELLINTVKAALKKRQDFKGKFNPLSHFFGYEGRCGFPSLFDAEYCFALGHVAASLIHSEKTGYMAALHGLTKPIEEWKGMGIPLTLLMNIEERKGKSKPVIKKALVDLAGEPFKYFSSKRIAWELEDEYRFPGPIQFYGPSAISRAVALTLVLERGARIAAAR